MKTKYSSCSFISHFEWRMNDYCTENRVKKEINELFVQIKWSTYGDFLLSQFFTFACFWVQRQWNM